MRYTWTGPEHPLSRIPCTATHLVVLEFNRKHERVFAAKGTITIMDYVEGGSCDHKWVAEGIVFSDRNARWTVRCDDNYSLSNEANGDKAFTLIPEVNENMKLFIGDQLTFVEQALRSDPQATLVSGPKKYNGPMVAYTGRCLCEVIQGSSPEFDWKKHTKGKFPERCFECSCGAKWWCDGLHQKTWVPVRDDVTWQMLTEHNGQATQPLAFHSGGVSTLRVLRSSGLIPLG